MPRPDSELIQPGMTMGQHRIRQALSGILASGICLVLLVVLIGSSSAVGQHKEEDPMYPWNLTQQVTLAIQGQKPDNQQIGKQFDLEQQQLEKQIRQLELRLREAKSKLAERAALRDAIIKFRMNRPMDTNRFVDPYQPAPPSVAGAADNLSPKTGDWRHDDGALTGIQSDPFGLTLFGNVDETDRIMLRIGKTETTEELEWETRIKGAGRFISTIAPSDLIPMQNNQTADGLVLRVQCDQAGIATATNIPFLKDGSMPEGAFKFIPRIAFQNDAPLQIGYIELLNGSGKVPVTFAVETKAELSVTNSDSVRESSANRASADGRSEDDEGVDSALEQFDEFGDQKVQQSVADEPPVLEPRTAKITKVELKPSYAKWLASLGIDLQIASTQPFGSFSGRGELDAPEGLIHVQIGRVDTPKPIVTVVANKIRSDQSYSRTGTANGISFLFDEISFVGLDSGGVQCKRLLLTLTPYDKFIHPLLKMTDSVKIVSGEYELVCDEALISGTRARLMGRVEAIRRGNGEIDDVIYAQEIEWDLKQGKMLPSSPTNFSTELDIDKSRQQLAELEGTWKVIKSSHKDLSKSVQYARELTVPDCLSFVRGRIYWLDKLPESEEGKADSTVVMLEQADSIRNPHILDVVVPVVDGRPRGIGRPVLDANGIYRLDGNRLIYCFSLGGTRPAGFEANNEDIVVLELERVEESAVGDSDFSTDEKKKSFR